MSDNTPNDSEVTKRQKGYYWVRPKDKANGEAPEICYWNGSYWMECLSYMMHEVEPLSGPLYYDGPVRLTDIHGFI